MTSPNENSTQILSKIRILLRKEYEEEKQSLQKLTDRIGVYRLVDKGNAWWPLSYSGSRYNSLNQRIVEVVRSSSDDNPDHNFEYGRTIMFFTFSESGGNTPTGLFSGKVSYVDGDRMIVSIPDTAHIDKLGTPGLGVMLSFDETSYRVMFEAIDRTLKAKGRLGELRDLIYSNSKSGELSFGKISLPYLNLSQQQAVDKVLRAKDFAIVHGPPGTGKTTTLVEAIYETLRREPQVMVCAQSNLAVDWISEKLNDRGIKVLRIGNPTRVTDKMLGFTYERQFEAHTEYSTLWSIRSALRNLYASNKRGDTWHQKVERLKDRATAIEVSINNDLFNEARVIACTLVGSDSNILSGLKVHTLFIDEAAQALEAATLIPISKAGRVILAGDHQQLPATVKSRKAMKGGLGKSLMERIVENHPEAVSLLTIQYRMHEDIMSFPNKEFYGGNMEAAAEVAYRGLLDLDSAIEWIDTSSLPSLDSENDEENADYVKKSVFEEAFQEQITGGGIGKINKKEARLTVSTLCAYLNKIGIRRFLDENIDVGIISPYKAQVRYIQSLISRDRSLKSVMSKISVNTVDGFQGQESDVIILSLVRNNEEGQIGFLRDLRRMNVALTRARMKLIIIGDAPTLCRHPFYRRLYKHVHNLNHNFDLI